LAKIDSSLLILPRNSPPDRRPDRRTLFDRRPPSLLNKLPEIRRGAEAARIASARAIQKNSQNAGFLAHDEMESQVR
jgi:hypothetical protein